jgi:hypothetical protein
MNMDTDTEMNIDILRFECRILDICRKEIKDKIMKGESFNK